MKTKTILKLKKMLAFLVLLAYLSPANIFAQTLGGIPASIRTPRDVANWIKSDFEYQLKMPDRPQSPQETMALRTGDCDDFAALASSVMSGLGIHSDILIIKFRDLKIQHAICIWKGEDGICSFLSSKQLVYTRERDIMAAVAKYYPDWEEVTFSNENRDSLRVVSRNS